MSVKEFLGFGKRNFGKRNFGKKVFEPKYLLQYTPRGYIIANKDTRRGYISRKGKEKYIRKLASLRKTRGRVLKYRVKVII